MRFAAALVILPLLCVVSVRTDTFGSETSSLDIEFVTIGNPGNPPDTRHSSTGFGAVDYTYRISKYEITAGQYTKFLNAVAVTDTYGLYNPLFMADFAGSGARIQQSGSRGNYSYSVPPDWANRPVNWVDFWDIVRFVNWLHNGQPTGPQGPGTTEDGAYLNIGNQTTLSRQPGAKFFIPTENEWYKAAYYDPNKGGPGVGGYWDYPTETDAIPGNDIDESTNPGNNANYITGDNSTAIGWPYQRTEIGEFELSASYYGTFDQGGNVSEWIEDRRGDERGVRGGSYTYIAQGMHASGRSRSYPHIEFSMLGFRIASAIPEPSTALLALIGLAIVFHRSPR